MRRLTNVVLASGAAMIAAVCGVAAVGISALRFKAIYPELGTSYKLGYAVVLGVAVYSLLSASRLLRVGCLMGVFVYCCVLQAATFSASGFGALWSWKGLSYEIFWTTLVIILVYVASRTVRYLGAYYIGLFDRYNRG